MNDLTADPPKTTNTKRTIRPITPPAWGRQDVREGLEAKAQEDAKKPQPRLPRRG